MGLGWKFLVTEKKILAKHLPGVLKRKKKVFPYKLFFFKNVPGVLKRMHNFLGGILGCLGCLGRPTPATWVGKRYTSSYDHDL